MLGLKNVDKGLILICGKTIWGLDKVLVKLYVLDGYLFNVEIGMLLSDISGLGENDGVYVKYSTININFDRCDLSINPNCAPEKEIDKFLADFSI